MKSLISALTPVCSATLLLALSAHAQYIYPGCDTLRSTDFTTVELFNKMGTNSALATNSGLVEPVQFDLENVKNTAGDSVLYTNIYFVERKGKVKFYDAVAKKVDSVGYIPNWAYQSANNANDNGLMGLALDPNFKTNRWIYFWYCPTIPGLAATNVSNNTAQNINRRLRLSRITVNSSNKLDMSTEKIMIDILGSKTDQYHAGGPMVFDRFGDLWVTIGNNSKDFSGSGNQYSTIDSSESGEWGSSNTASLRGGVFRIHPDNNATTVRTKGTDIYGPGYTVPSGNFGEYWAGQFEAQSNATLAAEYRDKSKVLPELYVKGTRSNYSIAVHPTKGWLAWGDVQYNNNNDEFNLVDHPVFAGMPYFMKNNVAAPAGSITMPVGHSAATPINNSIMNSGVKNLPPAHLPVLWYANTTTTSTMPNGVAIGGPIYVYDRNLKSSVKFPPHLHNSWALMTTYTDPAALNLNNNGSFWFTKLDSLTPTIAQAPQRQGQVGAFRFGIRNPIHALYGADGSLYVMNYGSTGSYGSGNNPGIIRATYTGTCKLDPISINAARPLSDLRMTFNAGRLQILEAGRHEVTLLTAGGREVFRASGDAGSTYELGQVQAARGGVYLLRVKTAKGVYARNLPLL